ncbi:hypothetical protein ACLQ29_21295 [Micromonospora sp. DT228]|uniref:hypothetical protein n=1 Tax=Micromonospora sp. DT228 TaxID=3393443 RepID=UPI003CEE7959
MMLILIFFKIVLDGMAVSGRLAAEVRHDGSHRPGGSRSLVTALGVEDFTDALIAYTIVEAGSHDEAVQIFSGHPHLGLVAGNSIAVLECPPPASVSRPGGRHAQHGGLWLAVPRDAARGARDRGQVGMPAALLSVSCHLSP